MMKGALLTKPRHFLLLCFPAGQDEQMAFGGKKRNQWHWSTEKISRVTSMHTWGLAEGFLHLKVVSSERCRTQHSMKGELRCSVSSLGCFPSPRLTGNGSFDGLLILSVERMKHEAYQIQVQSIWAKFMVGIDDNLHCFRWHFKQVNQCADQHTTRTILLGTIGLL